MEKSAAIVEGDRTRLGPILITTMTTCFGIIYMAVSLGTGSELFMPIAITVFGGLLTFTFLTLAIAHSIYSIIDSIPCECPRTRSREPQRLRTGSQLCNIAVLLNFF